MPRRALFFITTLVIALHWLVLHGVPTVWDTAHPPGSSTRAFSTRSIAAAPPAPMAVAVAATEPVPPPARAPKPKSKPKTSPKPPPSSPDAAPVPPADAAKTASQNLPAPPPPDHATGSSDLTGDANGGTHNGPVEVADATAPGDNNDDATGAATKAAATPTPPASAASAPAAAPPVAPSPIDTLDAGVDISPPGAPTGQDASTAPPPVRLPPPTRLAFDVTGQAKKFTYSARAELLWQHDGSHYEARQEISLFLLGSRSQRSTGQITPQGLAPERFSDRARSEQAAHFNRAKGRVTFSANTPEVAVGPGAQDRLSIFIQLGALLAGDPGRFVPGTQIALTTVSARSADRWTFTVEGPETLELPAGTTATLKLQRLPRRDYDQKAELWVAPALGYLPVRIQLTQANGDFADLRLRSSSAP